MDSLLEISAFNEILSKETVFDFERELARFFSLRFHARAEREISSLTALPSFSLFGLFFTFQDELALQQASQWLGHFQSGLQAKWDLLRLKGTQEDLTHQVVQALSKTLMVRDRGTSSHTRRVTVYCDLFCERLGLEKSLRKEIVLAGLLHDLGKIGVSDRVLLKTSALSSEEWDEMRSHTEWGYEIVNCFPSLTGVAEVLRHHHERWDGAGYPNRLAESKIPFGARIIAVADAFDAMTSDRPYRKALPSESARDLLVEMSGTQFDPEAVNVFEASYQDILEIHRSATPQWSDLITPQLSHLDSIGSF
jgi:HD-GYP domain-containing protein (c-di-GMP phosphodiesterase class II)